MPRRRGAAGSAGGRPTGLRPVRSATISTSSCPAALKPATSAGVTARSGDSCDTSTPTRCVRWASDRFAGNAAGGPSGQSSAICTSSLSSSAIDWACSRDSPTIGSTGAMTLRVRSSRPDSNASERSSSRMATACSSPFTATRARSALCAAKSRERGEVPACTSGRCPCTGRATFRGPVDAEVLAVEVGGVELGRIEEHAGRGIRHDRIVLERVPEPAQHVLELDDAVVARLVRRVEVLAVVARRARLGSGHQVQPCAPARQQVDRGRGAGERVRVGVAGVRGGDQADALGDAREVRDRRDRVDARHEVRVAELEVVPRGQPVAEEQVVEPRGLGDLLRRGGARRRRRAGRDGRPAPASPMGTRRSPGPSRR